MRTFLRIAAGGVWLGGIGLFPAFAFDASAGLAGATLRCDSKGAVVRSIDTSTRESAWTIAGDDKRWLAIEVVEHGADVELVGPGMPLNEVDTPPSRYAVEQLLGLKTADFE